jgi:hypothetical protein
MTSRTNYYKTVSQVYSFKNIADKSKANLNTNDEETPLTPLETINKILSFSDRDIINFDNSDIRMNSNISQRISIPEAETKPEVAENFEFKTADIVTPVIVPQNVSKTETPIEQIKTIPISTVTPTCSYHNNKASNNPLLWGPPFWYTLHNGAYHYPEHAGPLHVERMKNFILAIPIMIPCATCKEHATAFIDNYRPKLDNICAGKDSLFKFFVDFHNQVNKRYGKPELSYEEAYKIYQY